MTQTKEEFEKWRDDLIAREQEMMKEWGYVETKSSTICSYCGKTMRGYLEQDICSGCLTEWGHD